MRTILGGSSPGWEVLALAGAERRAWPTVSGTPSRDLTLPGERRVALSGDWESQGNKVLPLLQRLRLAHPDVHTILHVGDLRWELPITLGKERIHRHGNFLPKLEAELHRLGFRVLLTPGNHDAWSAFAPAFAAHPDRPRRLSPSIWVLPRGFRFYLDRWQFMSFGGAVSVDADRGTDEIPTEADVLRAAEGGPVDVLLTHEPPNAGIAEVEVVVASNPHRWAADRLELSKESRCRIDALVAAVSPSLVVHGHMHVAGSSVAACGHRTLSLPVLPHPTNTVVLDLHRLVWEALDGAGPNASAVSHAP